MKFNRKPQFRCFLFTSAGAYWIIIYYIKYNNIFILVHRIKYRFKPYLFFFSLVFPIILVLHFAETTVMLGTSFVFIACLALYATSMAQAFQTQRYNNNCGPRRNATGRRLTWTGAEYQFECDTVDALLRDSGQYVPRNNIALRAQIGGDDLYLAYPRWMMHLLAFALHLFNTIILMCLSAVAQIAFRRSGHGSHDSVVGRQLRGHYDAIPLPLRPGTRQIGWRAECRRHILGLAEHTVGSGYGNRSDFGQCRGAAKDGTAGRVGLRLEHAEGILLI